MHKKNILLITDSEGYLKSPENWNISIAKTIASKEAIVMTSDHWEIVNFMRNFYLKYNKTPSMKMLSIAIQKKSKKKNISIYLFKLFPRGPAQQASKIAGIPKPSICL